MMLSMLQFCVGTGIRQLKKWVKLPVGILSGIGLFGFPIGTLINAYILYLVFGKKGAVVFSKEYQHIIAATPQIKYRTSIVDWIFVGILVFMILIGLTAAFLSRG